MRIIDDDLVLTVATGRQQKSRPEEPAAVFSSGAEIYTRVGE